MIRDVLATDAEAAAALIREAFAAINIKLDPPPSALRLTAADISAHLQAGGGGAIDGRGGCILWCVRDGGLYVSRLAVGPQARGAGIAAALLAYAEAVARSAGLPRIHLEVRLALTGNRRLFQRAGFIEGAHHAHPGYAHPTYLAAEKWLV